jgi:predicted component of type VI protein secretion system
MYLLLLGDSDAGAARHDVEEELVIGRDPGGLVLDDPEVSRRHARVFCESSGRLSVEDLGSRNGTHVNGERVSGPRALAIGDRIAIGATVLQVAGDIVAETRLASPPAAGETVVAREPPQTRTPSPPADRSPRGDELPAAPEPAEAPVVTAPAIAAAHVASGRAHPVPDAPFGRHVQGRRHGAIASRRAAPSVLTFLTIVATAVALIVYFSMH